MSKKTKESRLLWPELISRYRRSLGLSVLKFAYQFEVSPQAVYMWESGQREAPYRVTEEVLNWVAQGGRDV